MDYISLVMDIRILSMDLSVLENSYIHIHKV